MSLVGSMGHGFARAIEGAETPSNLAIMAGASLLPEVPAGLLSGYFAGKMGLGAIDATKTAYQKSIAGDLPGAVEFGTDAVGNLGMFGAAATDLSNALARNFKSKMEDLGVPTGDIDRVRGSLDAPLDLRGRAEANSLAKKLVPYDKIYTNGTTRAQQTAGLLAAPHGTPVEETPESSPPRYRDMDDPTRTADRICAGKSGR